MFYRPIIIHTMRLGSQTKMAARQYKNEKQTVYN